MDFCEKNRRDVNNRRDVIKFNVDIASQKLNSHDNVRCVLSFMHLKVDPQMQENPACPPQNHAELSDMHIARSFFVA